MLSQILKKDIKEPLSIEMLQTVVPKWCGVSFYDKLKRFRSLKEALGGKKCMAVLYQIHDKKQNVQNQAGHFILLNGAQKKPEYFSSSGWNVAKEISATHSDPQIFQRLLGNNYSENRVPLEKLGNTNTCWRFVLARAILCDMPLPEFQKLFQHHLKLANPDEIVTIMTMLHVEALR